MQSPADIKQQIFDQARQLGFSDCRIAPARAVAGAPEGLAAYLHAGHHGQM